VTVTLGGSAVAGKRVRHDLYRSMQKWRNKKKQEPSPRSSARLTGKPQRSHVISFPRISGAENYSEDDGIEYAFRCKKDEF